MTVTTIRKAFNVLILGLVLCWIIPLMISNASGEEITPHDVETVIAADAETEEAGFAEIEKILESHPVDDMEGMDLEALTEALTENTMGEYYDAVSGFRMQYPSFLLFGEEDGGTLARSEDGEILLSVISTPDGKELTDEILTEAMKLEDPGAEIRRITEPDCLVKEKEMTEGYQADIYMISGGWLHHIVLTCTEERKESITPFIEYMINSMTTEEGDVG